MKIQTIKDLEDADEETIRRAITKAQVIPRIFSHLDDLNLKPHSKRMGVFSASDIGSKGGKSLCGKYVMGCARVMYYRYCGVEPKQNIDPRLRMIFNTGTKIHEQLQGYLHKVARASEDTEVFVDEVHFDERTPGPAMDLDIDSTTDGIWAVRAEGDEIRVGLEIKSMKKELFDKLNGPGPEVITQAQVYMGCLDLPMMCILYYNKNDSIMAEYFITFDKDHWEAIKQKIYFVRRHAVDGEEPPREDGFHCRTCRYAHVCKPPRRGRRGSRHGSLTMNGGR